MVYCVDQCHSSILLSTFLYCEAQCCTVKHSSVLLRPFTPMLQANCLQSFAKQPIRIKNSLAVINALILLVDRQCHHHTSYSDSPFWTWVQTHRPTDKPCTKPCLSAGKNQEHNQCFFGYSIVVCDFSLFSWEIINISGLSINPEKVDRWIFYLTEKSSFLPFQLEY